MKMQHLLIWSFALCMFLRITACEPEKSKTECARMLDDQSQSQSCANTGIVLTAQKDKYLVSANAASQSVKLKNLMADGKKELTVPIPPNIMPLTVFCMEQFHDCRNLQGKALLDQVYEKAVTFLKPILKERNKKSLKSWLNEPMWGTKKDGNSAFRKLEKKWPLEFNFLLMAAADYLQHKNLYQLATRQAAQAFVTADINGANWKNYSNHATTLRNLYNTSFAYKDIDRWLKLLGKTPECDHGYSIPELQEYGKLPRQMQYDYDLNYKSIANLVGLDSFIPQNTTYLLLQNNHLTKLCSSDPLPESLESLDLRSNPLQEMGLKQLTNLQNLFFNYSDQLHTYSIPASLKQLEITDNKANNFSGLSALQILNLSQNRATQLILPPSLRTLLVTDNMVTTKFDLSVLTSLQDLKIGYYKPQVCSGFKPLTMISYPPRLQSLSITDCGLSSIDDDKLPVTLHS